MAVLNEKASVEFDLKDGNLGQKIKGINSRISSVETSLRRLNQAGSSLRGLGEGIVRFGTRMSALSAAMSAPFVLGVKAASSFDRQMAIVNANVNATKSEFDALEKSARKLGASTSLTAEEAARGMVKLARAGLRADQILGSIKPVVQATISIGDDVPIEEVAETILNIFKGLGRQIETEFDASGAAIKGLGADIPVLVRAAQTANLNLLELGNIMTYVANIAGSRTLEPKGFRELIATAQILKERLGEAGVSGTSLRGVFIRLTAAMNDGSLPKVQTQLEKLRINMADLTDEAGRFAGVANLISILEDRLKGLTEIEADAALSGIFETRQINAVKALLKSGSAEIIAQAEKLDVGEEFLDNFVTKLITNLPGATKIAISAMKNLGIAIGNALKGPAQGFLESLTAIVNDMTAFVDNNKQLVFNLALGAAAFATASGSLLAFGAAISVISLPIIATSLALQALFTIITGANKTLKFFKDFANSVRKAMQVASQASVATATLVKDSSEVISRGLIRAMSMDMVVSSDPMKEIIRDRNKLLKEQILLATAANKLLRGPGGKLLGGPSGGSGKIGPKGFLPGPSGMSVGGAVGAASGVSIGAAIAAALSKILGDLNKGMTDSLKRIAKFVKDAPRKSGPAGLIGQGGLLPAPGASSRELIVRTANILIAGVANIAGKDPAGLLGSGGTGGQKLLEFKPESQLQKDMASFGRPPSAKGGERLTFRPQSKLEKALDDAKKRQDSLRDKVRKLFEGGRGGTGLIAPDKVKPQRRGSLSLFTRLSSGMGFGGGKGGVGEKLKRVSTKPTFGFRFKQARKSAGNFFSFLKSGSSKAFGSLSAKAGNAVGSITKGVAGIAGRFGAISGAVASVGTSMIAALAPTVILITAIGAIIASVTALTLAFLSMTNVISDTFTAIAGSFRETKKVIGEVAETIRNAFIAGDISNIGKSLGLGFKIAFLQILMELPEAVGKIFNALFTNLITLMQKLGTMLRQALVAIFSGRSGSFLTGIFDSMKKSLADMKQELADLSDEMQAAARAKQIIDETKQFNQVGKTMADELKEVADLEARGNLTSSEADAARDRIEKQNVDQELKKAAEEIFENSKSAKELYDEQVKLVNKLATTTNPLTGKAFIDPKTQATALADALDKFQKSDDPAMKAAREAAEEQKRAAEALKSAAKGIKRSIETPQEELNRRFQELSNMLGAGELTGKQFNLALASAIKETSERSARERAERMDGGGRSTGSSTIGIADRIAQFARTESTDSLIKKNLTVQGQLLQSVKNVMAKLSQAFPNLTSQIQSGVTTLVDGLKQGGKNILDNVPVTSETKQLGSDIFSGMKSLVGKLSTEEGRKELTAAAEDLPSMEVVQMGMAADAEQARRDSMTSEMSDMIQNGLGISFSAAMSKMSEDIAKAAQEKKAEDQLAKSLENATLNLLREKENLALIKRDTKNFSFGRPAQEAEKRIALMERGIAGMRSRLPEDRADRATSAAEARKRAEGSKIPKTIGEGLMRDLNRFDDFFLGGMGKKDLAMKKSVFDTAMFMAEPLKAFAGGALDIGFYGETATRKRQARTAALDAKVEENKKRQQTQLAKNLVNRTPELKKAMESFVAIKNRVGSAKTAIPQSTSTEMQKALRQILTKDLAGGNETPLMNSVIKNLQTQSAGLIAEIQDKTSTAGIPVPGMSSLLPEAGFSPVVPPSPLAPTGDIGKKIEEGIKAGEKDTDKPTETTQKEIAGSLSQILQKSGGLVFTA